MLSCRRDVALFAGVVTIAVAVGSGSAAARILSQHDMMNWWFDGDSPLVIDLIASRWSPAHSRAGLHPLWHYLTTLPYALMHVVLPLSPMAFARGVTVVSAAIWAALVMAAARRAIADRVIAWLTAVAIALSASTLAWAWIPETRMAGSATILACVWLATQAVPRGCCAAYVASMGITISNGMAGLVLIAVTAPSYRRAALLACAGLGVISGCAILAPLLVPTAGALLRGESESQYLGWAGLRYLYAFGVLPIVTGTPSLLPNGRYLSLSFQHASLSWGQWAVAGVWLVCCGTAVVMWARHRVDRSPVARVVGITLLGQGMLHAVYGPETFLYAMHFAPLLVLAVGMGIAHLPRRHGMALLIVLCVGLASVNGVWLRGALAMTRARYEAQQHLAHALDLTP